MANLIESLKRLLEEVRGLSARAVLNYVITEIESGVKPEVVIERSLKMAEDELKDLERVITELRKFLLGVS